MHNILDTLSFFTRNPGWQSYKTNCRKTTRAVNSLKKRHVLETNSFGQARYILNNSGAKSNKELVNL